MFVKSRKEVKNKIEEDEKVEAEERESLGKKELYIYNRKIVPALNSLCIAFNYENDNLVLKSAFVFKTQTYYSIKLDLFLHTCYLYQFFPFNQIIPHDTEQLIPDIKNLEFPLRLSD